MNYLDAVEELTFHWGYHKAIDDPRWDAGFLQTLRPYRESMNRDARQRVDLCLEAVSAHLLESPQLDRLVVGSLWNIVHLARTWALHPDSMLRKNNLITPKYQDELSDWLADLSYRVGSLLEHHDPYADHPR